MLRYIDSYRQDEKLRQSFNQLAEETFGLNFENWYQAGYWTDRYNPCSIADGERIVANVSVNDMHIRVSGQEKRYIQLGTVMTDKAYRGQGLARELMEQVIGNWRNRCDAIYLFANDSVLEFYPRFGFRQALEYRCECAVAGDGRPEALDMGRRAHRELVQAAYREGNSYAKLQSMDNVGLVMFYLTQFMKDQVYYLPEYKTVVIAEYVAADLIIHDIFGAQASLDAILLRMASSKTRRVILNFTPDDGEKYGQHAYREEGTTLFMLEGKENPFATGKLMFPPLSHA